MDEFYTKAPLSYNLEEFALAVIADAEDMELLTCTDLIKHYWSRKRLVRAKITAWYKKHKEDTLSASAFNDMSLISTTTPKPPTIMRLFKKTKALIIPKIQRQFAIELMNGCYEYSNEFDKACKFAWWETALKNLIEKSGLDKKQILKILQTRSFKLALGKNHCVAIANYLEGVD